MGKDLIDDINLFTLKHLKSFRLADLQATPHKGDMGLPAKRVIRMVEPAVVPALSVPALPRRGIVEELSALVIGQPGINQIVPYINMFNTGLHAPDRPVGVIMMLGNTGSGKTFTAESVAYVLHGSPKNLLVINCGEFQMEHEVAKLIGAPPGYLGHRETTPMLSQQRVNQTKSERCGISLVLFDEVEKAAPSMQRILLGVFDRATLKLGDNTTVDFSSTLIFMTSNLGTRQMQNEMRPAFGMVREEHSLSLERMKELGIKAMKKRFAPEFFNRVDEVIAFKALDREDAAIILDNYIVEFQAWVDARKGHLAFRLDVTGAARKEILNAGYSREYGARELRRAFRRMVVNPISQASVDGQIEPGEGLVVDYRNGQLRMVSNGRTVKLAEWLRATA